MSRLMLIYFIDDNRFSSGRTTLTYDRQVSGLTESRDAVLDAERRGECLMAFDLADRGLRDHPDDLWLRHRAVLALARAGSTKEAARRFAEYGLNGIDDEDVAALEARLAKDEAL